MNYFRHLKTDYLESRFSAYESFAEWFLKRKLGFLGQNNIRISTLASLDIFL